MELPPKKGEKCKHIKYVANVINYPVGAGGTWYKCGCGRYICDVCLSDGCHSSYNSDICPYEKVTEESNY